MAYVVAEPCIGSKETFCVDVCPVDCIHPRRDETDFAGEQMLFIDPDTCIECGACEPACPRQAIFTADTVPEQWQHYIQKNADWYRNRS